MALTVEASTTVTVSAYCMWLAAQQAHALTFMLSISVILPTHHPVINFLEAHSKTAINSAAGL
jgi:hypothetical protein